MVVSYDAYEDGTSFRTEIDHSGREKRHPHRFPVGEGSGSNHSESTWLVKKCFPGGVRGVRAACRTIMDPGDDLVTIIESGNHTGGLPHSFGPALLCDL